MGVKPQKSSLGDFQDTAHKIKQSKQGAFLIWNLIMVGLIIFNLTWIFFDTLFDSQLIQDFVHWVSPKFFEFYATSIHPDFLRYDLMFVSIYILDLLCRWAVAIRRKTYHRWFFFPFANWYDVLGCIPIGSFHILRLLRIVVILRRLQSIGVIDLSNTYVYRKFKKYVDIVTEEISDRVVVQVLDGVQEEVGRGTPMLHRIIDEVVLTRRKEIGEWISLRMTDLVEATFEHRRVEIHEMIQGLVGEAANRTETIYQLQKIPVLGGRVQTVLEESISSMVYEITEQILMYFKGDASTRTVHELIDVIFDALADPKNQVNYIFQTAIIDAIELVKEQVKVQQWKLDHALIDGLNGTTAGTN